VLVGSVLAATAVRLPGLFVDEVFQGLLLGLLTALALAGPLTIRRAVRQRRAFQRRGWQLAAYESQRRANETRAAVQRERMTLAAEMHDGLGHSLTLIAVRLGQLSLKPTLSQEDRTEVAGIREIAADASDDLGLAVRLLRETDASDWKLPTIEDAVEGARRAGIQVDTDVDDALAEDAGEETANAVTRVIQEGLTNAAKHAGGQPVFIRVRIHGEKVVARISNPLPEKKESPRTSEPGFGLAGLRHRATMLGGRLDVDASAAAYTLTLTLPLNARPSADRDDRDPGAPDILAEEDEAAVLHASATRAAIAVPVAIAGALVFVATGYFVLANTLPVLSPSDFAQISVGDDQATVEYSLPARDMLDAPRDEFPALPQEECRYVEAEVSFFERVDVHVVCFASGKVSRTGTVPAP
jgi:signal transduction histidine kinase